MPNSNFIHQRRKNYLSMVSALPNTEMFKHMYVFDKQTKKQLDTLENGRLSCAYVVSCVLALHGFIDRPHATVQTTIQKMLEAGWHETNNPLPGSIVRWPSKEEHGHIGFYISSEMCISNSAEQGVPVTHALALSDGRVPELFYTHDILREATTTVGQ